VTAYDARRARRHAEESPDLVILDRSCHVFPATRCANDPAISTTRPHAQGERGADERAKLLDLGAATTSKSRSARRSFALAWRGARAAPGAARKAATSVGRLRVSKTHVASVDGDALDLTQRSFVFCALVVRPGEVLERRACCGGMARGERDPDPEC